MATRCDTAAVLGAGVMGSAIAAHLAGAGMKVLLLDMVPPDVAKKADASANERNAIASKGLKGALKAKPAAFFDPDAACDITVGNFDDDLSKLADIDLVVEAVVERMDIKRSLWAKVAKAAGPHTLLASNTSGLSIAEMCAELPKDAQERFLVMHFFNPVRYMHLLELVPGPNTAPQWMDKAAAIGTRLGKGIVYGKDTPNFVANRIGVHGIMAVISAMDEEGLSIEQVDKIVGAPMGRPKSACFRTGDLVGIDTLGHVAQNCFDNLVNDEARDVFQLPAWIQGLIDSGKIGQKAGAGFYKKEGKEILVFDPATSAYRAQNKVRFDSLGAVRKIEDTGARIKALIQADDAAGRFAWKVLSRSLAYASFRMGEIADDVLNIDRAMRWGFNWAMGPFETWDAIGVGDSVARMQRDGVAVAPWVMAMLESGQTSFYGGDAVAPTHFVPSQKKAVAIAQKPHAMNFAALHAAGKVVKENMGASLVDLGDGCLALEVHTKMNTLDADVISMIHEGSALAEKEFDALVLANDGEHFGAGANLMLVMMASQSGQWDQVETMVRTFQDACQMLRYAKVPVVAAPFQYTFGGATELCLAVDACQAHAEAYMGLVEVGAGLVPAGGGCLRMMQRFSEDVASVPGADLLPHVGAAALNIAMAKVGTGAEDSRRLRYLSRTDGVSLSRSHLLYAAKSRALGMARAGYMPPRAARLKAAGVDAAASIKMQVWGMQEGGFASAHDGVIAGKVAHIMCGGAHPAGTIVSEQEVLDLEREAFLSLCGEEKTQARMQSILMNNRPLRN